MLLSLLSSNLANELWSIRSDQDKAFNLQLNGWLPGVAEAVGFWPFSTILQRSHFKKLQLLQFFNYEDHGPELYLKRLMFFGISLGSRVCHLYGARAGSVLSVFQSAVFDEVFPASAEIVLRNRSGCLDLLNTWLTEFSLLPLPSSPDLRAAT